MGIRIKEAPSGKEIVGTADGQILVWNNTTQRWDVGSAPSGGSTIVASVIGKRSNGDDVPSTPLYTVPVGKSGLYRASMFIGPASVNGFGQVFLNLEWPEFPPGTGNLTFMKPAADINGLTQASFLIGEGSSAPGSSFLEWWAQEGQVIGYNIDVNSWEDGDYVFAVTLEELVSFSNPNPP